jgi:hypothetical protein
MDCGLSRFGFEIGVTVLEIPIAIWPALLRMGKPDEAEAMLKQCPSIKSFSDQSFLDSKDPRFSG